MIEPITNLMGKAIAQCNRVANVQSPEFDFKFILHSHLFGIPPCECQLT